MTAAVKKIVIGIVGGTVLLIGLALLVLPGPGLPLIAAGIAILATEFLWAKHVFRKVKVYAAKIRRRLPFGLDRFLRRRPKPVGAD
jgi:tellurite resistance protein TerC